MNWKKWTGSGTFWRTLRKSSLLIFLAAVLCLLDRSDSFSTAGTSANHGARVEHKRRGEVLLCGVLGLFRYLQDVQVHDPARDSVNRRNLAAWSHV